MSAQTTPIRIPLQDNFDLEAHFLTPSVPIPGVLFIHGWGGDQRFDLKRAHHLAGLGCVCLTFDLTGHHASQAQRCEVTREQNLQDVCAAYDRLLSHPWVDPNAIALIGHSYGAYLAVLLSQLRPVRWLSLLAPALYQDEGWFKPKDQLNKTLLSAYRKKLHPKSDNQALRACAVFSGDVLLLETEHDNFIPRQTILSYRNAFLEAKSITHRILYGADHGLTQKTAQQAYSSLLFHWAHEMIMGARTGLLPT
ncbi:alpha/beta hydrolase family protein [Paenalcaligenes hominis]|uniref:alpha/beta hydrolase family protein n=1 Tax=Paenalcaligenes hominis TaxID=643674 RepID=UPI00352481C0